MISKKALIAGMVGLVFVVGGTATVLESFGTVSGTADVYPGLKITEVNAETSSGGDGEMFEVYNPSSAAVDLTAFEFKEQDTDKEKISAVNQSSLPSEFYGIIVSQSYDGPYKNGVLYFTAETELELANQDEGLSLYGGDGSLEIDSISWDSSCGGNENLLRVSLSSDELECGSPGLGGGDY